MTNGVSTVDPRQTRVEEPLTTQMVRDFLARVSRVSEKETYRADSWRATWQAFGGIVALSTAIFTIGWFFSDPYTSVTGLVALEGLTALLGLLMGGFGVVITLYSLAFFTFLTGRMAVVSLVGYRATAETKYGTHYELVSNALKVHLFEIIAYSVTIAVFLLVVAYFARRATRTAPATAAARTLLDRMRVVGISAMAVGGLMYLPGIVRTFSFVREHGYYALYMQGGDALGRSGRLGEALLTVGCVLIMASLPSLRLFLCTSVAFVGLQGMRAMSGQRSFLITSLFFVLAVAALRYRALSRARSEAAEANEGRRPRWAVVGATVGGLVVAGIGLLALFNQMNLARGRNKAQASSSLFDSLYEFFYAQGVSVNTVSFVLGPDNDVPSGRFYSLGPVINFFQKYILQGEYLELHRAGPSVELALRGHQLGSYLSWKFLGPDYAKGMGVGSSGYVEGWADGQAFGLIIAAVVVGTMLGFAASAYRLGPVARCAALFTLSQMFLIPRSTLLFPIQTALQLPYIAAIGLVVVVLAGWTFIGRNRARKGGPAGTSDDTVVHADA